MHVYEVLPGDEQFYDVQTTRSRHVVRLKIGGIHLTPDWPSRGPQDVEENHLDVQLLIHAGGFLLMRLTLADEHLHGSRPTTFEAFRYLNRIVWEPAGVKWRAELRDVTETSTCGVRDFMDLLFFHLHERSHDRRPEAGALSRVIEGGADARYGRLDELVAAGEIKSAYPVVFGTHYEFGWDDEKAAAEQRDAACRLARGAREEVVGQTASVEGAGGSGEWLIGENQSVVIASPGRRGDRRDEATGGYDPLRLQIVEYLNLQRAALRSVQRATQLVITERRHVKRRDVSEWERLVAAYTDDYVLHDQVATVLEPLQRHLCEDPSLRDPGELERQVRSNLATFDAALGAGTDRAGVILSLLFGIVAAVALTEPIQRAIHTISGLEGEPGDFADDYPVVASSLDLGLIVVIALLSAWIYRRASRPEGW